MMNRIKTERFALLENNPVSSCQNFLAGFAQYRANLECHKNWPERQFEQLEISDEVVAELHESPNDRPEKQGQGYQAGGEVVCFNTDINQT